MTVSTGDTASRFSGLRRREGWPGEALTAKLLPWTKRRVAPRASQEGDTRKPLVILLQGPVGPFFSHLHKSLEETGYRVVKINFNAADWAFSRRRGSIMFARDLKEWHGWFDRFVGLVKPDCVMMFGCRRPVHQTALEAAAKHGVPAFCFEEGYVRPGFITMEEGGNNDMSPLRTNEDFLNVPADADAMPAPAPGRAFGSMCWHGVSYFTLLNLGKPFFGANRHHRQRSLLPEAFLWSRNAVRKQLYRSRNFAVIESLLEHEDGRYFLVALQVHDDLQLSCSGRGWTNERLITESIASFSRAAPSDATLVFKVHPLSRGHTSYRSFVRRQAELFGCTGRVRVIDDGSVGLLTRHARGIITVNSTSGLSALFHMKPLMVMGDALFRHPDLATCGETGEDLDRFWREAKAPDPDKARNLLGHIRAQSLVPGSFYLPRLMKTTCENVIARMEAAGVKARARRRALTVIESKPSGIRALGAELAGNVVSLPLPAPTMPAVQSRTA